MIPFLAEPRSPLELNGISANMSSIGTLGSGKTPNNSTLNGSATQRKKHDPRLRIFRLGEVHASESGSVSQK